MRRGVPDRMPGNGLASAMDTAAARLRQLQFVRIDLPRERPGDEDAGIAWCLAVSWMVFGIVDVSPCRAEATYFTKRLLHQTPCRPFVD